ncbi:hypothetical protein EYR41_010597 [Orbilia oligospora]|uniref:Uncharacterized protein n=1 Tax=Orbilia oligospora TaxID=2813651 RepID=A0A8H2DN43_ORBOL|nr:hypothetical protein EYR41_010597 [Orbilia oligospora]
MHASGGMTGNRGSTGLLAGRQIEDLGRGGGTAVFWRNIHIGRVLHAPSPSCGLNKSRSSGENFCLSLADWGAGVNSSMEGDIEAAKNKKTCFVSCRLRKSHARCHHRFPISGNFIYQSLGSAFPK